MTSNEKDKLCCGSLKYYNEMNPCGRQDILEWKKSAGRKSGIFLGKTREKRKSLANLIYCWILNYQFSSHALLTVYHSPLRWHGILWLRGLRWSDGMYKLHHILFLNSASSKLLTNSLELWVFFPFVSCFQMNGKVQCSPKFVSAYFNCSADVDKL